MMDKIKETVVFLQEQGVENVDFGLILGSGLGELADEISNPVMIDYADIPNEVKNNVITRIKILSGMNITESEYMETNGLYKIYDCGKFKFEILLQNL